MKTQIKILLHADNATTWRISTETVIILYESKNKDGKGKTQTTIKKTKQNTKTTLRESKKLSKNQDYPWKKICWFKKKNLF